MHVESRLLVGVERDPAVTANLAEGEDVRDGGRAVPHIKSGVRNANELGDLRGFEKSSLSTEP